MDNYRPISLLTSISKLFEKVVFDQLYVYFQNNQLFYSSQYGFRILHSTEFAALELIDRTLKDIDERNISLAIIMDFSQAFDTLDHQILLKKLNYGKVGNALAWFSSYLTGRQQYVELDGVSSSLLPLSTGVPQGSILGPVLFLLYMNDILSANEFFKYILYAHNTTLFSTIHIPAEATHGINNHLSVVNDWLAVNKLSLNVKKKTKHIIFHAINKIIEGVIPELQINGLTIDGVQNFNFIGLYFNEHLFWKPHIDIVANKLIRFSGVINKLKRFLPIHILRTLYFSMVQSRLTYGILAWGFEYQRFIKLQKRFL